MSLYQQHLSRDISLPSRAMHHLIETHKTFYCKCFGFSARSWNLPWKADNPRKKKKFSWKANFSSKTDYTAVFQPAVPGILLTERATRISTGVPNQQMDLEVQQTLSSEDNIICKEDNTTSFTSMKKQVWVIIEQMREKSWHVAGNLPAGEAFDKRRFSSLRRAQCFHISHFLEPKQAHYTGLSVQHHQHFTKRSQSFHG